MLLMIKTITSIHVIRQMKRLNILMNIYETYCKTSNISRILLGNNTVYHSDVVGASPVDIFILHLTAGFKGLVKDTCKTRLEILGFGIWCDFY